jgi:indole-3-glycerol phosphate synthase/phosphoribosylanthranilate isomerase
MQNKNLIGELLSLFGRCFNDFWARLYARKTKKPFIKICGITRERDAETVCRLGTDVMGFIFAPSPRRAAYDLPPRLKDLHTLKVGVVVLDQKSQEIDTRLRELLEGGFIDALQFHGDEAPERCFNLAFPYYKAIQIADKEDVGRIKSYHCPRVLIDAFSREKRGGTGKSISNELVKLAARQKPLWLAGGIGVHNVRSIIENHNPELIDASTRLEASAGCKDRKKLAEYFKEIEHAEVL